MVGIEVLIDGTTVISALLEGNEVVIVDGAVDIFEATFS